MSHDATEFGLHHVDYDTANRLLARTEGAETTLYFYWAAGGTLAEETDAAEATKDRYLVDENALTGERHGYRTVGTASPPTANGSWPPPSPSTTATSPPPGRPPQHG